MILLPIIYYTPLLLYIIHHYLIMRIPLSHNTNTPPYYCKINRLRVDILYTTITLYTTMTYSNICLLSYLTMSISFTLLSYLSASFNLDYPINALAHLSLILINMTMQTEVKLTELEKLIISTRTLTFSKRIAIITQYQKSLINGVK